MSVLTLFPHAKINLGLFIKGKRKDGYHLLETLLYPLFDLRDELSIEKCHASGCHLILQGIPLDSKEKDNLVFRAYMALKRQIPDLPGVNINLKKNIPSGAGLGGGSSDAAFTLRGLKQLFELNIPRQKLVDIAAELGADVPFFLFDEPMMAEGTGTKLSPYPISFPYRIELITSHIHSSTVAAYRALDLSDMDLQKDLRTALSQPVSEWKQHLFNDLEPAVFHLYPELNLIKRKLYKQGAIYAAMSGSGSAVFGIFEN